MKYDGTNFYEVIEASKLGDPADFTGANLNGKEFKYCDLTNAIFSEAILTGAIFKQVTLKNANFDFANLYKAYLVDVDVTGARFYLAIIDNATLRDCNMHEAAIVPKCQMTCPDSGSFVGWKKCFKGYTLEDVIVKLLIPEDAKRSSSTGRKCRCDKAIVLEIQNMDGTIYNSKVYSKFATFVNRKNGYYFTYEVGKTIVPQEPFDENRWNECASGIHFFITREEAVDY